MNYSQAYDRVQNLKRFYKSVTWFALVALFLFVDDCFDEGSFSFSHFELSPILLIWGLYLSIKAFKLFVFDSEWENAMIEKEMKNDSNYK